ncbi:MAG: hypothetical protein LC122_14065 [Chitinophagales bacterium]|nr:hypothetical protein [Chitinophagales bacterium]
MILIGSRALALRAPYCLNRKPVDFDFIASQEDCDTWLEANKDKMNIAEKYEVNTSFGKKIIVKGDCICEFDIISPDTSNALLAKIVEEDKETIRTSFGLVPSFNILFLLKKSHRYLKDSPHFWKTIFDFHTMKRARAIVQEEHMELFKLREKETYAKQNHPKLNVNKNDFFSGDGIIYTYDHDSLHESVKHLDKPAYLYYGKDGEEVKSDKNKFFACDRQIQLYGVVEEAAVLALERGLIPHYDKWKSHKDAWMFALSKVCSSITSGWFREFAYENIFDVVKMYPKDFYEKFQVGLKSGVVKPFTGSKY